MSIEAFVDIFPNTYDDMKIVKNFSVVSHRLRSSNLAVNVNNSSYFILGNNKLYNYVNALNIIQVSCSVESTLFLENTGRVLACGRNDNGSLGIGNYINQSLPVYVKNSLNTNALENIVQISTGNNNTMFLENTGRVLGCGENNYGQLGIGINEAKNLPVYVQKSLTTNDFLENIVQISSGNNNTMFLENTGRVLGCGENNYGQLGIGINEAKNLPVYVQKSLTTNDFLENIVQISSGAVHTMFLENTGRVLCCGWNKDGQLGIGDYQPDGVIEYM
jgi:alpha-tubulin suppressor-like RCC1 family protein